MMKQIRNLMNSLSEGATVIIYAPLPSAPTKLALISTGDGKMIGYKTAFDCGYEDAKNGKPESANPFSRSRERSDWDAWDRGHYEYCNVNFNPNSFGNRLSKFIIGVVFTFIAFGLILGVASIPHYAQGH